MKSSISPIPSPPAAALSSRLLLTCGAILLAASAYRWGVPLAAWIAPVPFLLVMRRADAWRQRLVVLGVLTIATLVQVGKIVTEPVPWPMIFPFALPSALAAWAVLLGVEAIRRRRGEVAAAVSYVALAALWDWISSAGSPLGVWGTAASMHVDDQALLQVASVAGVPGIAMVVALVPAMIAMLLGAPLTRRRVAAALTGAALVGLVYAWGSVRLFSSQPGPTVRVAAVVTDLGPGSAGLPSPTELAVNEDALFERTRLAAKRGAEVVVWNEAATLVQPADEARLLSRSAATARELGAELVVAYGVLVRAQPLQLDNKYVWFSADGQVIETYRKHHPVPGEPSLAGEAPLVAHDHSWGRGAGAICYDYDFPAMARAHSRLGAGVVVVPSSDWRGIDPYHTQIARIGAISGGFSIVRSVRWATSAAYDAYGRERAAMRAEQRDDRIMLATVPVTPVPTLYAQFGDVPVVSACAIALIAIIAAGWRRRHPRPTT